MNQAIIIGNLTRDPEVRYSTGQSQMAIGRITVAVTDGYGDKQYTSYIPVKIFGKTAENVEKFLSKGSKVAVRGRIQTGSYEKDGRKVYTTDVIADQVEFLGRPEKKSDPDERQIPLDEVPPGFEEIADEVPF